MIVAEYKSKFSKRLIVKKIWDWGWHYYVTTGVLTQSGGLINDIWKPVINNYKLKIKNCLVLGLATGTLAKILVKLNPRQFVDYYVRSATYLGIPPEYFLVTRKDKWRRTLREEDLMFSS